MKSLLTHLYEQGFRLKDDSAKCQKELHEQFELVEECESELKARFNAEEQKLFEEYLDSAGKLGAMESCKEFTAGFRLGSRMIMEIIFGAEDAEFKD